VIRLTRRYRFAAAHVLAQPAFSDERNRQIFGKCANPHGHGHDYEIDVTLEGEVDATSGCLIERPLLDRLFRENVAEPYAERMLNECPPFGELVPTAENIARVVRRRLAEAVASEGGARVVGVRVIETARNHAESGETR